MLQRPGTFGFHVNHTNRDFYLPSTSYRYKSKTTKKYLSSNQIEPTEESDTNPNTSSKNEFMLSNDQALAHRLEHLIKSVQPVDTDRIVDMTLGIQRQNDNSKFSLSDNQGDKMILLKGKTQLNNELNSNIKKDTDSSSGQQRLNDVLFIDLDPNTSTADEKAVVSGNKDLHYLKIEPQNEKVEFLKSVRYGDQELHKEFLADGTDPMMDVLTDIRQPGNLLFLDKPKVDEPLISKRTETTIINGGNPSLFDLRPHKNTRQHIHLSNNRLIWSHRRNLVRVHPRNTRLKEKENNYAAKQNIFNDIKHGSNDNLLAAQLQFVSNNYKKLRKFKNFLPIINEHNLSRFIRILDKNSSNKSPNIFKNVDLEISLANLGDDGFRSTLNEVDEIQDTNKNEEIKALKNIYHSTILFKEAHQPNEADALKYYSIFINLNNDAAKLNYNIANKGNQWENFTPIITKYERIGKFNMGEKHFNGRNRLWWGPRLGKKTGSINKLLKRDSPGKNEQIDQQVTCNIVMLEDMKHILCISRFEIHNTYSICIMKLYSHIMAILELPEYLNRI